MLKPIDGKFSISVSDTGQYSSATPNIQVVNTVSGEPIPDDEPLFLLRAWDIHAVETLRAYADANRESSPSHQEAIRQAILRFLQFTQDHRDRMKEPGVTGHIKLDKPIPPTQTQLFAVQVRSKIRRIRMDGNPGFSVSFQDRKLSVIIGDAGFTPGSHSRSLDGMLARYHQSLAPYESCPVFEAFDNDSVVGPMTPDKWYQGKLIGLFSRDLHIIEGPDSYSYSSLSVS